MLQPLAWRMGALAVPVECGGRWVFAGGMLLNLALTGTPWVAARLAGFERAPQQLADCALLVTIASLHYWAETAARSTVRAVRPGCAFDGWYRLLAAASCLGLLVSYWVSEGAILAGEPVGTWWSSLGSVVGSLLAIGGIALRAAAVRQLGAWFATDLGVAGEQPLVTGGLYRWVRHPSETGLLLLAAGIGLLGGSLPLTLALTLQLPLAVARIGWEERVLETAWGSRYRDYARRVARVLPGVW